MPHPLPTDRPLALYWFSGTGNTLLAARALAATLRRAGLQVALHRLAQGCAPRLGGGDEGRLAEDGARWQLPGLDLLRQAGVGLLRLVHGAQPRQSAAPLRLIYIRNMRRSVAPILLPASQRRMQKLISVG